MAKQSALVGDLTKQDGVTGTSIMRMEQKISRVRSVMANLEGTFNIPQEFPERMPEDRLFAPIYTVAPPAIHEYDPRHIPNLHSFTVERAFKGLAGGNKEVGNRQNPFSAEPLEMEITTKLPLYDGTKNPYVHLGAYLSQAESMELDDELKRKLFVKTLTGSALIWYVEQDTSKWTSWSDLVLAFIDQYKSYGDHHTCNSLLKRKSTIEPISEKFLDNTSTEAQPKDMHDVKKGKGIITETSSPISISLNNQAVIPVHESQAGIFEKLKSMRVLQPQRGEVFTPLPPYFYSTKHCAFHSNIPGHDTNECVTLRKEIQRLVKSGKIVEMPKGKPQLMWCQPLTFAPTVEVCPQSVDRISFRKSTNSTKGFSDNAPIKFTLVKGSYASLYERLKNAGIVHPIERKSYKEPWKADMKKSCVYHSGMRGHDIEKCFIFKEKIDKLIKSGQIKIDDGNDKAAADDQAFTVKEAAV